MNSASNYYDNYDERTMVGKLKDTFKSIKLIFGMFLEVEYIF